MGPGRYPEKAVCIWEGKLWFQTYIALWPYPSMGKTWVPKEVCCCCKKQHLGVSCNDAGTKCISIFLSTGTFQWAGEGWIRCAGNSLFSIPTHPGFLQWRGDSHFATVGNNRLNNSLRVSCSSGILLDARLYFFWWWERRSYFTGQLTTGFSKDLQDISNAQKTTVFETAEQTAAGHF